MNTFSVCLLFLLIVTASFAAETKSAKLSPRAANNVNPIKKFQYSTPSPNSPSSTNQKASRPSKGVGSLTLATPGSRTFQNTPPALASIQSFASNAADECLDIFDALVYAKNNKERMENMSEILDRHKTLITTVSLGLAIRQVMSNRASSSLAKDVLGELRKKEMMKWGSRRPR